MVKVILLGSAATLADRDHDSIYLLVQSAAGDYLIDCGGSPPHKLAVSGAKLEQLRGVLFTHDHADHMYGFPLLVQALMLSNWDGGWEGTLNVWGLRETLATARALLDVFELAGRIPLDFREIPPVVNHPALETAEFRLLTTPVLHSRPTIGVRIENKGSGRVLAYSGDTEPCSGVLQLAAGADVLLHEATVMDPHPPHSTPAQAGEMAATAGVKQLVLVHFDPLADPAMMLGQAGKAFGGSVDLGYDGMAFDL